MPIERAKLAGQLRQLAQQGVYFGTSSWKYPGWFDSIYERDRYVWRGRFSESRFERNCLSEYAETFPAVSVDAGYYQFFSETALNNLGDQVPEHFRFGFKVCADITLKRFPHLARYGPRAGQSNAHFLNAALFTDAFLARAENIRSKIGVIMFEFSRFAADEFERGAAFVEALDQFFEKLPRGWPFAVEIRNRQWLRPEYFQMLAARGVTHIFNAWTDMPPVGDQVALPGSETNPELVAMRCLLREGRSYEQAVKQFSPYTEIKEPNLAGRASVITLAKKVILSNGKARLLVFINNRYEGYSPGTIQAIASGLAPV